jgi:hypothetical protein
MCESQDPYWDVAYDYATVTPTALTTSVSVTLASGAGPRQAFTFQYSSAAGRSDGDRRIDVPSVAMRQ